MKTDDLKEKWRQFRNQRGYLQRVDPNHPMDFFIGISDKGYDELVLFTYIEPALIKSSKALEITKNRRKDGKWATQICSVDSDNQDIFARLCTDLLETSYVVMSERDGLELVTKRFLAWQKLFASLNTILSKSVLKGLVGELSFALDVLSYHFSWDEIMSAWQGPDGADRDYIFSNVWFEVKAVSTGKDKVTISSLNQLETEDNGFLVKIDVDESSSTDSRAVSVNDMINSVRGVLNGFPNASVLFEQKLVNIGYTGRIEYDDIYFTHGTPTFYSVDDKFPKLVSSSVPVEIVGAEYDLSLVGIDPWRKGEIEVWN
ncbi:MAG: PD-(D/E)XK motif protein [Lachnospiraceae bacterium]|nr:PD-(D/E)XK motif protein [Lachnospiraceae bacterium]